MMQKFIQLWSLIILTGLLAGCSSSLDLYLKSAPRLNQDQQYKSLPVQVKIYQLSNQNAFMQATFRELWQQDSAVLGNSLLDQQEITVDPDSSYKIALSCKDKTRYIGIIAIFRQPEGDNWRVLYPIPSGTKILSLAVKLNLIGNKITLDE